MTDTLSQRLGKAFRNRREALGFSQESYADEIGMHRTYYSAIERGDYPCSWIPSSGSAKGCRR